MPGRSGRCGSRPIRHDPAPAARCPRSGTTWSWRWRRSSMRAEAMLHLTGPAPAAPAGRTAAPRHRPLADQPRASSCLRRARRCPRRHPPRRAHDAARSSGPQPGPARVPRLAARTSEGLAADPSERSGRWDDGVPASRDRARPWTDSRHRLPSRRGPDRRLRGHRRRGCSGVVRPSRGGPHLGRLDPDPGAV